MKLKSLKINKKPGGWQSNKLFFGDKITQIYGPNGCGKTPIIQFMIHCLGYPAKFRRDIYENCLSATLDFEVRGELFSSTRELGGRFHIKLKCDGTTSSYYNENEWSQKLFEILGIKRSKIVDTKNKPTSAYVSTFLPLLYRDQDIGYSKIYWSSKTFIKDQYTEMVRLLFDLEPKHFYESKSELIKAQAELSKLDSRIVRQEGSVQSLFDDLPRSDRSSKDLDFILKNHQSELAGLKDQINYYVKSEQAILNIVSAKETELNTVVRGLNDLSVRVDGLERMESEIDAEINTLTLNEDARNLFHSFKEICRNPNCGLFLSSSESYGKNLLYLKDQIKDLRQIKEQVLKEVENFKIREAQIQTELDRLRASESASNPSEEVAVFINAISELTYQIIELQKEKTTRDALDREVDLLARLQDDRDKCHDKIASLRRKSGEVDLRALKLRKSLTNKIINWLDISNTVNVSRDISINSDFVPVFGLEDVNQLKGSTRVRAVLAVQAAIFETFLENTNSAFRFLILDTPKQQELQAKDLLEFIKHLDVIAGKFNAQFIFSSTEYRHVIDEFDVDWLPDHEGFEQKMFLGH